MRKVFVSKIAPNEIAKLAELMRKGSFRIRKRAKAILLSGIHRYSVSEISRMLNFHPNHLRKWIHRYNRHGIVSLLNSPECGVGKKFDEKIRKKIISIVRKHPRKLGLLFSRWTLHNLKAYLEKQKIVDRISHETIRKILMEHNVDINPQQID